MGGKDYLLLILQKMEGTEISKQGEPAKPGLTPSKTGEWSLSDALRGRKIFLHETDDPIKEALRYAMLVVGLREKNMPFGEEKQLLINFIKKEYSTHTAEEIRVAFDCAITGKLGVDATCYENFSIAYFAKVFTAYREWAVQQITGFKPDKSPKELPSGPMDWSEQWEALKTADLSNSFCQVVAWSYIYEWLKRGNMLTLSNSELWDIAKEQRDKMIWHIQERKGVNRATPEERNNLERLKCIDWKTDRQALKLIETECKEAAVRRMLAKLKAG